MKKNRTREAIAKENKKNLKELIVNYIIAYELKKPRKFGLKGIFRRKKK